MIRILIAGIIAAVLAMSMMEKQQSKDAKIINKVEETQQQLDDIFKKNQAVKEGQLQKLGM